MLTEVETLKGKLGQANKQIEEQRELNQSLSEEIIKKAKVNTCNRIKNAHSDSKWPFNQSVPDAPNWRISIFGKRFHETETS